MTTTPPTTNGAAVWQPTTPTPPIPKALTLARRVILPPSDAIRKHDAKVADWIDAIRKLEGMEYKAATDYAAASSWTEAIRQDREWLAGFVRAHHRLPGTMQGPLGNHHRTIEDAYITALRHSAWVDICRADLANHLRTDHKLQDTLSDACDEVQDQIQAKWTTARDQKDRRALDDGLDLCKEWLALRRLCVWAINPDRDYKPPYGTAWPDHLSTLKWEAEGAITGTPAVEVPDAYRKYPDAPRPVDAPRGLPAPSRLPSEGSFINGQPTKRTGIFRRG